MTRREDPYADRPTAPAARKISPITPVTSVGRSGRPLPANLIAGATLSLLFAGADLGARLQLRDGGADLRRVRGAGGKLQVLLVRLERERVLALHGVRHAHAAPGDGDVGFVVDGGLEALHGFLDAVVLEGGLAALHL